MKKPYKVQVVKGETVLNCSVSFARTKRGLTVAARHTGFEIGLTVIEFNVFTNDNELIKTGVLDYSYKNM